MKGYEKYKEVGLPWLKVIPEEWEIKPNKVFLKYQKNVVGKKADDYELLSLTKQGIQIKGNNNFSGKMPDNFESYQIVEKDQLVMCLFDLDISAVFSGLSNYTGKITSAYDVFNIYGANHRFVDYYFRYIFQDRKYKLYSKSVRYTITKDDFRNLKTPIPLLHEQEQIANFLDWKIGEIDRLIELEQKKINEIKSLKTKIIDKYMFIESDYSVKLKFLGKFVKGRGIARENLSDLGKYPVILYGDIYTKYNFSFSEVINKVDFDVFDNAIKIHENTLLFPTSGETKEDIGKTVLYEGKKSVAIGGDVLSFTISNEEINANYLMYYLNSSESLAYKYVNGRGDIIVHISEHSLNKIVVNFPSMDKQIYIADKISQKFDEIEMLLNNTIKQISYLEELKQTLISDAVTGKIDVRDIKIPHIFTERRKANEFNRKRI